MTMQHLPSVAHLEQTSANSLAIDLRIEPQLVYFDGHFPHHPILPGVTQLHWAEHFARQYIMALPPATHFIRMEAIKFQHLLRPENPVTLELDYRPDTGKLYFRYAAQSTQFSSGRLVYSDNLTSQTDR